MHACFCCNNPAFLTLHEMAHADTLTHVSYAAIVFFAKAGDLATLWLLEQTSTPW